MVRLHISRVLVAASLLGLFAHATAASANIVTNGSFESGPAIPPAGIMQLPVGSTAINGWQVILAPIDLASNSYWEPGQGTRSLGLNSTATPGGIAQTFATQPGIAYTVSFKMAGESFTTPALKQLRVRAAGQQADFQFDSSSNWHWAMLWAPRSWTFVAEGSSTAIEFVSLVNAEASPTVDDIVVTEAIPTGVPAATPSVSLALRSPNPARGAVAFSFTLPEAGPAALEIADAQGRRVATLAQGGHPAGAHAARWNGESASSGVYFVTLRAGGSAVTRRFALIR